MNKLVIDEGVTLAGNFYPGPIDVEVKRYQDLHSGPAIVLITHEEGYPEPLGTVTVNMEGVGQRPVPGAVFVKDYSENEGILDIFEKKGWMSRTGRVLVNGFVKVPEAMVIGALADLVKTAAQR